MRVRQKQFYVCSGKAMPNMNNSDLLYHVLVAVFPEPSNVENSVSGLLAEFLWSERGFPRPEDLTAMEPRVTWSGEEMRSSGLCRECYPTRILRSEVYFRLVTVCKYSKVPRDM